MIFVSTGGFRGKSALESTEILFDHGIRHVELSGGAFSASVIDDLKGFKGKVTFQVHNYFPPPKKPVVLNLATPAETLAKTTFDHMTRAIRCAAALGRPVYSFHAGFLLDPVVSELGKRIGARPLFCREESLERFIGRVCLLADVAAAEGVFLLIENNVVSRENFAAFGANPMLMTGPEEATYIMEHTPANVGLLLDVAHLKVSAATLGFDPVSMFNACHPWIRGYHLSDNDGTRDSNDPVARNSWFWPHLKCGLDYYSLEVYRRGADDLREQQQLAETMLQCR